MLKISICESRTRRRLVVEGRLSELWVDEFRTACEQARTDLGGRDLVIDLKQITAISQEAENLLLALMGDGVKLRCSGVFTKQVLQHLARRKFSNLQEKTR